MSFGNKFGGSGPSSAYVKPVANASSRYYVTVDNMPKAVFSEVSGLQMETELFEYQEGGNNSYVHRLPGITKAGNVTLKRGVARDNELFKWYQRVARGVMDLRSVTITLYATQEAQPVVTWELLNAFPCKWTGPQLAAGTDAVAIETIELAHVGILAVE